jgi:hypothetical protein
MTTKNSGQIFKSPRKYTKIADYISDTTDNSIKNAKEVSNNNTKNPSYISPQMPESSASHQFHPEN